MFLNFIGSGSALNTELGNNSAAIIKGESILLIDCGSTTFSRLQELSLLDNIKNLYVLITHRHPDHIASLGDLIFYARYILKTEISIFTPDTENVTCLLKYMGVKEDLFHMNKLIGSYTISSSDFKVTLDFIKVPHVDQMECYGYLLDYCNTKVFYSGDSKDIPADVLKRFLDKEIDYLYQDVCSYSYPDNPHLYIQDLCSLINMSDRNRVFCMHYDEDSNKDIIKELGFSLVDNIGKK